MDEIKDSFIFFLMSGRHVELLWVINLVVSLDTNISINCFHDLTVLFERWENHKRACLFRLYGKSALKSVRCSLKFHHSVEGGELFIWTHLLVTVFHSRKSKSSWYPFFVDFFLCEQKILHVFLCALYPWTTLTRCLASRIWVCDIVIIVVF